MTLCPSKTSRVPTASPRGICRSCFDLKGPVQATTFSKQGSCEQGPYSRRVPQGSPSRAWHIHLASQMPAISARPISAGSDTHRETNYFNREHRSCSASGSGSCQRVTTRGSALQSDSTSTVTPNSSWNHGDPGRRSPTTASLSRHGTGDKLTSENGTKTWGCLDRRAQTFIGPSAQLKCWPKSKHR